MTEIAAPRRAHAITLAISAALVGAAAFVTVLAPWRWPFALAAAVVPGLAGGFALRRLARPRPALTLDDAGFVDNSRLVAAGRVAWTTVVRIEVDDDKNVAVVRRDGPPVRLDPALIGRPAPQLFARVVAAWRAAI